MGLREEGSPNSGIGGDRVAAVAGSVSIIAPGVAAGVAALALSGWAIQELALARLTSSSTTMSPSTAVVFLCLATVVITIGTRLKGLAAGLLQGFLLFIALLVLASTIFLDLLHVLGPRDWFEALLISGAGSFAGFEMGRMSAPTAVVLTLLFSGVCALTASVRLGLRSPLWPDMAGALGAVAMVTGALISLFYLFDADSLYAGSIAPSSLPTAIALICLGSGLLAAALPVSGIASTLAGSSIQMQMMRGFLPLIVLVLFVQNASYEYFEHSVGQWLSSSFPLAWNGIMTVTTMILSAPLVLLVTRGVQRRIESTERSAAQAKSKLSQLGAELESSHERLKEVVAKSPTSIVLIGLDGVVVDCNPATELITGRSVEEMRGAQMDTWIHPDDRQQHRGRFEELASGQIERFEGQVRVNHRNGNTVWGNISVTLLRGKDGEPELVLRQFQDITLPKKAEEELGAKYEELDRRVYERTQELLDANLRLQEEADEREALSGSLLSEKRRLDTISGNVDVGLFLLDGDARITYVNELAHSWFSDSEHLIGRLCWEVFGLIDPDAQCVGLRAARTGEVSTGESFTRIVGGEKRYLRVTATPVLDEDGRVVEVCEVVVDLTERKQAEERMVEARSLLEARVAARTRDLLESNTTLLAREEEMRAMTDSARDPIVQMNSEGLVSYWNPAAAAMFGYDSDEASGQPLESLIIPGSQRAECAQTFRSFRQTGSAADAGHMMTATGVNKEGAEFPIELSLSSVRRAEGWITMGVIRDLTEREAHEAEMREGIDATKQALDGALRAISRVAESAERYKEGHHTRVAQMASIIALDIGLSEDEAAHIEMAALVHDVGKISIPSEILGKPGRLAPEELEIVKGHSRRGHDILQGIQLGYPIARIALEHHERFDGSGYPGGLAGEQIHVGARIVAVADYLDAMSSQRPHRPAQDLDVTLEDLRKQSGTHFDPEMVDAAVRVFGSGVFSLGT